MGSSKLDNRNLLVSLDVLIVSFVLWHEQHESMDPPCLVPVVQAGARTLLVGGILS